VTQIIPKATICLWFDRDAEKAARFYAATFPDSSLRAMHPEAEAETNRGLSGLPHLAPQSKPSDA